MANAYINLYKGNPTSGGTDGTIISLSGAMTSPIEFALDATQEQSKSMTVALRCESGYSTAGTTTISFIGTTAAKWSVSSDNSTWSNTLAIENAIGSTNTLFYVKATSSSDEAPGNDTSVMLTVEATITTV